MAENYTPSSIASEGVYDGAQSTATRGLWWDTGPTPPPPEPAGPSGTWFGYRAATREDGPAAPYEIRRDNFRQAKNVWLEWALAGRPEEEDPRDRVRSLLADQAAHVHREAELLRANEEMVGG